ncbi:MAG: hypothetical protein VXZ72_02685 [Chlamydiota bacterium]|nr:hypothetical protein [Chlamydiota bacterium]
MDQVENWVAADAYSLFRRDPAYLRHSILSDNHLPSTNQWR